MAIESRVRFNRHLPDQHVPPQLERVRSGAAKGPRILGHRRAHDGAVLCPQILSGDRNLRQRKTGKTSVFDLGGRVMGPINLE